MSTVTGATRIGANPRLVTTPGRLVDSIVVEVPTHAVAVLSFASGVVGTLTASFDLWSDHLPHIEIYGTTGHPALSRTRTSFDGEVRFKPNRARDGRSSRRSCNSPAGGPSPAGSAGLGVADLVDSLRGRPQRTSAQLAFHVLEVLESVGRRASSETVVHLKTRPGTSRARDGG